MTEIVNVRMAEMDMVRDAHSLKTILGSCVGVILHDPVKRVSALAHVMLPRSTRGDSAVGKYADTAIPALLALLTAGGSRISSLKAYLIGGAKMFPMASGGIGSIGDQNVSAARKVLEEASVPIVFEDTGGTRGRTVIFNNESGEVSVHTLSPAVPAGAGV
ncbi:MAG: chemotaxis protein CheD [Spirochaetia bacterium]